MNPKQKYRIDVKPLSVNEVWQGKRFKTKAYKEYEKEVSLKLKPIMLNEPPYSILYRFGMSNPLSDFDNPVKPFTDILQKKYKFNDRDIYQAVIQKVRVKKGEEFIEFSIFSLSDNYAPYEIDEIFNLK